MNSDELERIVALVTERVLDHLRHLTDGDPCDVGPGQIIELPLIAAIAHVLSDGVPRTGAEIAKLVGRRRTVVDETLATDPRFVLVSPPRGRSSRARTWVRAFQGQGQVGTSRSGDREGPK